MRCFEPLLTPPIRPAKRVIVLTSLWSGHSPRGLIDSPSGPMPAVTAPGPEWPVPDIYIHETVVEVYTPEV